MGTSGSYTGSGGREWGRARQQAEEFVDDPSPDAAAELVADIADALDWDAEDDASPEEQGEEQPAAAAVRPRGGRGDGPGAVGGAGGRVARAAGAGGGRSRSRRRAARVGSSVAAAGLALRGRDATTLLRYGLVLAELEDLDAFDQAARILDAVTASSGAIQEDELRTASAAALLALLGDEAATAADAVRVFVVEYVFAIAVTEIGDDLRDGRRPGWASVEDEDVLHDLIEARVAQVELPDAIDAEELEQSIFDALEEARSFLRARG